LSRSSWTAEFSCLLLLVESGIAMPSTSAEFCDRRGVWRSRALLLLPLAVAPAESPSPQWLLSVACSLCLLLLVEFTWFGRGSHPDRPPFTCLSPLLLAPSLLLPVPVPVPSITIPSLSCLRLPLSDDDQSGKRSDCLIEQG
jgi:hypothetical protein